MSLKTCLNGETPETDNPVLNVPSTKSLTTNPDECKDVGFKPMESETAGFLRKDEMVLSRRKLRASNRMGEKLRFSLKNKMVMGYFRSTNSFNTGKIGEFNERKYFKESKCAGKQE